MIKYCDVVSMNMSMGILLFYFWYILYIYIQRLIYIKKTCYRYIKKRSILVVIIMLGESLAITLTYKKRSFYAIRKEKRFRQTNEP